MKYCPKCGNLLDNNKCPTCDFIVEEDVKIESTPIDPTTFKTGMMVPPIDYEMKKEENK